jgi:hypothetical protein
MRMRAGNTRSMDVEHGLDGKLWGFMGCCHLLDWLKNQRNGGVGIWNQQFHHFLSSIIHE